MNTQVFVIILKWISYVFLFASLMAAVLYIYKKNRYLKIIGAYISTFSALLLSIILFLHFKFYLTSLSYFIRVNSKRSNFRSIESGIQNNIDLLNYEFYSLLFVFFILIFFIIIYHKSIKK